MSDTAFCTIVTKSHISFARALAHTIARHNPESKFYVLLADNVDGCFDPENEPFELISLDDLSDHENINKMLFYYNAIEMCFVLRAWLHEYMFKKTTFSKWVYLDADIAVYHSFHSISNALDSTTILLSTHLLSLFPPPSIDFRAVRKLESHLVRHGGIFQGGFLGLRKDKECLDFISWFKEHLLFYGFNDRPMHSGDQFWMTYIPAYFDHVSVLRNPGANLAYWNLYERTIEQDDEGQIRVDGNPLLFYHFAGFDMQKPNELSKYPLNKGLQKEDPHIIRLARDYYNLVLQCGYEETRTYPYTFAKFKDGHEISPEIRRIYYNDVLQNKARDGSPFDQHSYFKSRLRSNKFKKSLGELGRSLIYRIRKVINPDYDYDLP